jgi:ABC-2 type transport system permease protein
MATPTMPAPLADPALSRTPGTIAQILILARYQLRDFYRSRRFIILYAIVVAIGAIFSTLIAHFRPASLIDSSGALYGTIWGGGVTFVIVLAAIFFGGDAIAGEFQNKTGYFLMGLPIKRTTVYAGKFIAAYLASVAMVLLYLVILVLNGIYYFGGNAFPWQLGLSLVLALVYLAAVLGATFLFSSLFKTSAYGFVLTAILFLFGFTLLQDLIEGLVNIEPWMVISYAEATIGNVFAPVTDWGLTGQSVTVQGFRPSMTTTVFTPGIAEGVVIMLAYFLVTGLVGLVLFEREEFS